MDVNLDATDIQSQILQNTLVEVALSKKQPEADNPNETCCVICLDSITEICEARPCSHRNFDYLCLLSWLEQQKKCPLCKSNVDEVWYDFENDSPDAKSRVYLVPPPKASSKQPLQSHAQIYHPRNAFSRPNRRRYEEAPPRRVTVNEAILRRQDVYRNQLYSLHVGSNQRSGYRDLTPQVFESDPEMISRARTWLRRELQVFEFLRTPPTAQSSDDAMTRRRANNAEFLLEYIIAILKTVDIQGSQGQAEEMLKDFLGRDNTKLLLHELKNFLRSPWSLEAWDRKVQYPTARKRPVEEGDVESNAQASNASQICSR
ncbi:putative RING finger protein C16G5.03 [Daldinia childiae]|uniref:putative RING finger protein C16G5.03 n=1 Tax=Daldinia childiae TaxID=326645 RepID=UPI0014476D2B|nr:putative RING finger protein C16G5.03 [Daldinia childiae]KAF3059455.1 putative RING finger protein C16G5.03 [Daldinia childiae]